MAALATNRKLDIGNFMVERSIPPSNGSNAAKTPVSNGDELADQASPTGLVDNTSLMSKIKSAPASDDRADDLENSSQAKVDNLPPEKQLGKLKRFLQTVYSFAEKLPSQKDRVRQLIIDLINTDVTAQEFYVELRGSTKFPLRPFVVPFLESSLPLLRTSLNLPLKVDTLESEIFGLSSGSLGSSVLGPKRTVATQNGVDRKRRAATPDISNPSSPKRSHFSSQQHSISGSASSRHGAYPNLLMAAANLVNGTSASSVRSLFPNTLVPVGPGGTTSTTPVQQIPNGTGANTNTATSGAVTNGLAALTAAASSIGGRSSELTATTSAFQLQQAGNGNQTNVDWWTCQTDEWRNIETLFTTMATTMERLRYALLLFQQRARLTQLWNEKFQQHQRLHDSNMKIEEMQRKADAAVQEVKRAAVSELQKAVHAAEQKALHMIATERAQMEKLLRDTQAQEDSTESCRNCGRRAGQTCSGCGKARYCGVFCQHKDWPRHRASCTGTNDSHAFTEAEFSSSRAMNGGSTDESRSPPTSSITIKTEFSPIAMSRKDRVSPKSV